MKTIKIIDLLNKKENGEEMPKKFKYDDNVFIYDNEINDYIYEDGNVSFFCDYCSPIFNFEDCLATFNKEVEITEKKEIEKLDIDKNDIAWCEGNMKTDEDMVDIFMEIKDKINELIDAVNELKRGN